MCVCVRWLAGLLPKHPALYSLKDDIQAVAGLWQLCAGQIAGVEAAVHAVRSSFDLDDTEGVLLVDVSNAFDSLSAATLYTSGDILFFSEEGTTRGDPLAMPMCALATLPLSDQLPNTVTQVWYADDVCAFGSIIKLCDWWDRLHKVGPGFGYNVGD